MLALARTFVPSTAIASRLISPSAISAVTLCVKSRSRTSTLSDPEVGEPVIVQRHAAREPPIGGVALREPLQFTRRTHPFDRRIKPQRKQNRGIGGRPSRFALARENPIVKRRKIEALDETPHEARAMVRRQQTLQDRSYPSAADADPAAPPELPPSPIHLRPSATVNHSPSESANSFTRSQAGMTIRPAAIRSEARCSSSGLALE